MASSTIKAVFGKATEIFSFVDDWVAKSSNYINPGVDPVTGEVRQPVELEPLVVPLSLSFGNLKTGDNLAKLNDDSKMLIAVVCMIIEKIPKEQQTYDTILAALLQNPLIEAVPGSETSKDDIFHTTKKNIFNFKGSVDSGLVSQATGWIEKFIGTDLLAATHLDSKALATVVAQTGAVVTGFKDIMLQTQEYVRPALNIGVIQFPDDTQPDFKLYHIDLMAWSRCERLAILETNENGIRGSFQSRTITLRRSIADQLADDKKQKLILKGDGIFD